MGTPLVQRLATSKTIIAPLLPLFLRLSSAVESESNRCVPLLPVGKGIQNMFFISLSIDKSIQYIYSTSLSTDKETQNVFFTPFPMDSESVHCNFHALSTTKPFILTYHQLPTRTKLRIPSK